MGVGFSRLGIGGAGATDGMGVQESQVQPTEQKISNEHTHNLVLGKTENGRNPFRRSSEIFDL